MLGTRKVTCHWLGRSERSSSRAWQFRLAWRDGDGRASEAPGERGGGPPRRELSGAENSTRGNTLGREKEVKQSNGLFPSVRFRGRKC